MAADNIEKMILFVCNGYNISNARYIHYDSVTKRTLIYAAKAPKGFHRMRKHEWSSFTESEKNWALRAGNEINRIALKKHEPENAELLNTFLNVLEAELKKAEKAIEEGDANG